VFYNAASVPARAVTPLCVRVSVRSYHGSSSSMTTGYTTCGSRLPRFTRDVSAPDGGKVPGRSWVDIEPLKLQAKDDPAEVGGTRSMPEPDVPSRPRHRSAIAIHGEPQAMPRSIADLNKHSDQINQWQTAVPQGSWQVHDGWACSKNVVAKRRPALRMLGSQETAPPDGSGPSTESESLEVDERAPAASSIKSSVRPS